MELEMEITIAKENPAYQSCRKSRMISHAYASGLSKTD